MSIFGIFFDEKIQKQKELMKSQEQTKIRS